MTKTMKSRLALLLALAMMVCLLAVPAAAEDNAPNEYGIKTYVALGDSIATGLNDNTGTNEDAYGSWEYNLPLHFCSFMSILAVIALWFRWRPACTLVYFGVLVGSIQGLITPAMANGYPSLAFYVFFIAHGLLLIVALAIPVLMGWRARGYDDIKALLLMDVYVLIVIPINLWLDTNYGYTQGVPIRGTLLDYLGEAPWYYLWAQLPVLAVFRLLMLTAHDKNDD
jgi:hypothetical integral membrane protein (TIGR02206 family)